VAAKLTTPRQLYGAALVRKFSAREPRTCRSQRRIGPELRIVSQLGPARTPSRAAVRPWVLPRSTPPTYSGMPPGAASSWTFPRLVHAPCLSSTCQSPCLSGWSSCPRTGRRSPRCSLARQIRAIRANQRAAIGRRRHRAKCSHTQSAVLIQSGRQEVAREADAPSDPQRERPQRPGCLVPFMPVSARGRAAHRPGNAFTTAPGMQKALSHGERASTCGNW